MRKTPGLVVVGLAFVVGGCSSTKSTTRVSYTEPAYSTPSSYQYTDSGYVPPAYDHGTYREGSMVTSSGTTSYSIEPTHYDRPVSARTVNMPGAAIRYDITLDEFRRHMTDQTAVIVDARETKDFSKGHVRGAINVPVGNEDDYMDRLRGVEHNELIIVYCGGPDCPAGNNVAGYLASQGYTNIRVFKPGYQQLSQTDMVQ